MTTDSELRRLAEAGEPYVIRFPTSVMVEQEDLLSLLDRLAAAEARVRELEANIREKNLDAPEPD